MMNLDSYFRTLLVSLMLTLPNTLFAMPDLSRATAMIGARILVPVRISLHQTGNIISSPVLFDVKITGYRQTQDATKMDDIDIYDNSNRKIRFAKQQISSIVINFN